METSDTTLTLSPIGYFHGEACRRYDAPRQGVFTGGYGVITLAPGRNFETALRDLTGFERLWLVFVFHLNGSTWRPTASPPVPGDSRRVGLFASRSPYRPNPIGLSCVRLLDIRGRRITVGETDLLDGTPILDIKPYVPAADAFPNVRAGWVDRQHRDRIWTVRASPAFLRALNCVRSAGAPDLLREATLQLSHDPFSATRKRVKRLSETEGCLALRMFRLRFACDDASHILTLTALESGYTRDELAAPDDPYEDKAFHRALPGD